MVMMSWQLKLFEVYLGMCLVPILVNTRKNPGTRTQVLMMQGTLKLIGIIISCYSYILMHSWLHIIITFLSLQALWLGWTNSSGLDCLVLRLLRKCLSTLTLTTLRNTLVAFIRRTKTSPSIGYSMLDTW